MKYKPINYGITLTFNYSDQYFKKWEKYRIGRSGIKTLNIWMILDSEFAKPIYPNL